MKLALSVAIIASNEENNIGHCLRSIVDIASEIIIIVNDCTDKTCQIAESFDAKIYYREWNGFSVQKNIALGFTSQPWVLCLDADEEVDDMLRGSLEKFIHENDPKYFGAYFSRRTFFMNRWIKYGNWAPDHVVRLTRRNCGVWTADNVHEQLKVEGKVGYLKGYLRHYSYRSMMEHMHKNLKYAEFDQGPKDIRWSNILLRSFWKFFRGYFVKLGFLDGIAGLYIALTQGFFTLYKYALRKKMRSKQPMIGFFV